MSRKVLKYTLLGLGSLFMILVFSSIAVWFYPQLFVSESSFQRYVVPHLSERGFALRYARLDLSAVSLSFWQKKIEVESSNLCFQLARTETENCISDFRVVLVVNLKHFRLHRIQVKNLRVKSDRIDFAIENQKNEKSQSDSTELVKKLRFGQLNLQLPRIIIRTADNQIRGALLLTNDDDGFRFDARATSENKTAFDRIELTARRDRLKRIWQEADYEVDFNYLSRGFVAKLRSEFVYQKTDVQGQIRGELRVPSAFPGPLSISDCKFSFTFEGGDDFIEGGGVECHPELSTRQLLRDHRYASSLPQKIRATLLANVARESLSPHDLRGRVKLELDTFANDILDATAVASYEINFSDENSAITFDPIPVQFGIRIKDFRSFARILNSTRLLIPSPLNVLRGGLNFNAKGELHPDPFSAAFQVAVQTKLNSPGQALDMVASGVFNYKACTPPAENTFVEIKLETANMQVQLPNIDYKNPPAVVPDSRFKLVRSSRENSAKCEIAYNFSFKNRDNPILVSAPLLKNSIPLDVELTAQDDKALDGILSVKNYSTIVFRRRATVESFRLDLKKKEVDGNIRVDYTDYRIFISVTGQTQSLHLSFMSDPPLSREEVLSILLFGKKLEGLEPGETGSVRNASAAAKDGALSLASLYIFASTPIESVGYNPNTNGLVTKIKLADGTSLNVGANAQGLTDVGLTRRLSKHWRIQTTLQEPDENAGRNRSASTLLEWFTRF